MVFSSSVYVLWAVLFVLELAGIKYITQPQFRIIRWLLAFCALRDMLLLAIHSNTQAYWDAGWLTKEVEMIWLALVAGKLLSLASGRFFWPAKVPGIGIALLCLYRMVRQSWPFLATPQQMQNLQWHCQVLILGTLLIGCLLSIERKHLELAGSVAILALSGLVSAVSFGTGNYAPQTATATWAIGLFVLLAAVKGMSGSCGTPQSRCATSTGE